MSSGSEYHLTAHLAKSVLQLTHAGLHGELRSLAVAFLLAFGAIVISTWIYRVTFHPLAKYPGPFLRKISQWPDTISAVSGKRHLDLYKLHQTYGEIVRVGPNILSFRSSEAFRQLHADRNANVIKAGNIALNRDVIPVKSMISMDNKQEHSQRRKLVSHAFSEKALSQSENLMIEKIDEWTDALAPSSTEKDNVWSSAKNMSNMCNLLALDVISKLCFGKDYGAVKAGETEVHYMLINGAKFDQMCANFPLLSVIKPILKVPALLKFLTPRLYRQKWGFRILTQQMLKERAQMEAEAEESGEETQQDFFHHIFKARDPVTGEKMPVETFASEAVLLVAAGSDTTSTALSSLLFYLNYNPEVKAKLEAEIRSAFDDVNNIRTGSELSSLHYLRACIDEALRMNPPVPSGLSREVLRNGMTLNGELVPEGTVVNVALYGLHRDERYFPEPHKFIPERWIAGSKMTNFEVNDELLAQARGAFNPFSAGMRNCVGKNMAYQEMSIAMARLIFLYDMRFSSAPGAITGGGRSNGTPGLEAESDFCYEDFFITTKMGPYLEYKKREISN